MYLDYYGFKEKPFTITPNPRFIFLSKNHKEVFAHLLYGIQHHAGFIEVTGEVGTGKTTVLRTLLSQLDDESYRVALILNPCLSAFELLRTISREFGIEGNEPTTADLLESLNRFLLEQNSQGRTVVLVIDEAQNLEPQVLEQIRLLSNLETETDKLIQIVLVGQPELGTLLQKPELRQLSQRVTVRYHLKPMDYQDSRAYIQHRLEIAGFPRAAVFSDGALKKIFSFSSGYPRLINIICDRALLIGYTEGRREITPSMIRIAIREFRREGGGKKRTVWAIATVVGLILVGAGFYLGSRHTVSPDSGVSSPSSVSIPASGQPLVPASSAKRAELGRLTEIESAIKAFNSVVTPWGMRPVIKYSGSSFANLENLAARRQLRLLRVTDAPETLLTLNSPAMLEIALPGNGGKRYLAITGRSGDRVSVVPALGGDGTISLSELRGLWTGLGYVPWRNFQEIPDVATPETTGRPVLQIQQLLRDAGVLAAVPTGVFDRATMEAVERFQKSRGLPVTGRIEGRTLLLLYQNGRFNAPRLSAVAAGGGVK